MNKPLAFPEKRGNQLNIYFHVSENSGVGYYRQYLPAWHLRESGLANTMISDFRWGEGNNVEPNHAALFEIANWADLIVIGRLDVGQFYAQWGGIREFFNLPIVVDTDDNVHHVRPHNPGYQGYYPGSEALIWNKYAINKIFDALTVSTQDLKEVYQKDHPKIYLLPNNLDMSEWNKHESKQHNDGFIRMGFICSGSHADGVELIRKPIIRILEKHKNAKFMITGIFRPRFNDAPKEIQDRIEPVPWIPLKEWPKGFKGLGLDIGIAPLTDNLFNRAKTNLRWMEYSAAGLASVVSPVKPYLCVQNNKDGFFAKEQQEWFNKVEDLILNEKLRYTVGKTANKRINEEYSIEKNISLWEKTYREIHDKFHDFFGSKKRYIHDKKAGEYRLLKI